MTPGTYQIIPIATWGYDARSGTWTIPQTTYGARPLNGAPCLLTGSTADYVRARMAREHPTWRERTDDKGDAR